MPCQHHHQPLPQDNTSSYRRSGCALAISSKARCTAMSWAAGLPQLLPPHHACPKVLNSPSVLISPNPYAQAPIQRPSFPVPPLCLAQRPPLPCPTNRRRTATASAATVLRLQMTPQALPTQQRAVPHSHSQSIRNRAGTAVTIDGWFEQSPFKREDTLWLDINKNGHRKEHYATAACKMLQVAALHVSIHIMPRMCIGSYAARN